MPKLTKTMIGKLGCPPDKAEAFHWDGDVPGFGLRVRASGVRRWIVQYRTGSGQRRVPLGDPAAVPPDKARDRAKEMLAQVRLGQDPQAERKAERQAVRVGALVDASSPYSRDHIRRFGRFAIDMDDLPAPLNPQPFPFEVAL
jgi:hypothetical protein